MKDVLQTCQRLGEALSMPLSNREIARRTRQCIWKACWKSVMPPRARRGWYAGYAVWRWSMVQRFREHALIGLERGEPAVLQVTRGQLTT
ncbi:hypothetical protein D3C87_1386590 [compost metagenome]|nr:hypothetical protein BSF40_04990 [Pseudomonas sp. ACN5]